jgi:hypothetical protein
MRAARRALRRHPLVIESAGESPRLGHTPVCVVHIVRAANDPASFRAFVDALRRCPPGTDYELVLALKGFASPKDAETYVREASILGAEVLFFADTGFDLGVYFAAASRLRRTRYCFLNSFSEPLLEGWLAKLDRALASSDVGIVGASGSWNSSRSWIQYSLGLPSPYARLLPSRAAMREQFAQMDGERAPAGPPDPSNALQTGEIRAHARARRREVLRVPRAAIHALAQLPQQIRDFEPFPAHHVRTNAFMIAHSTLATLRLHEVLVKRDAYALESGRNSLTRQVQRAGLRAVVVDRAGKAYDQDEWHRSRTFWQGSQEGLLVADNQTRSYARGGGDRRRLLSALAWGPCADPSASAPG